MAKRGKKSAIISGLILLIIISIIIVRFFNYSSFLNRLQSTAGISTLPDPLQQQIVEATKKARFLPTSDKIGMLGMVYHSGSFYEQAQECYEYAVKKNSKKWLWNYYLGYLFLELGESDKAIENFRSVIKNNPEAYLAWYYVGEGYSNLNESYKAEVAFNKIASRQVLTQQPGKTIRHDYFNLRTYAMYQLARIYMNTERSELATVTLEEILKFYRTFGPAYRLLGAIYSNKGDSALSEYYLIRANDLSDFAPPVDTIIDKLVVMSRSESYLLKQIDEAERDLYPEWALEITNNALQYIPDNKYIVSKAIKLNLKVEDGKKALTFIDRHISAYNDDFNELKEVADLLYEKGYYAQSLIYYYRATKLKPDDPDAQYSLALCLSHGQMKQNAVDLIIGLMEKRSDEARVLSEGIYHLILLNENDKASGYLARLSRLAPSNAEVKKLSGMLAENYGSVSSAIHYYESAFSQNPEDLLTIRYLGNIYIGQGLWSEALNLFRRALKQHPNDPFLLQRLGTLLVMCPEIKLRDYKMGKEYSERAFINKSSSPEILIASGKSLGEAYAYLGDKNNARTFLNIAINIARNEGYSDSNISEIESVISRFNLTN